MPPEHRPPDDPIEWLNRAKSNLARATADINLPGIYLEDLCFDAHRPPKKRARDEGSKFNQSYQHDGDEVLKLFEVS